MKRLVLLALLSFVAIRSPLVAQEGVDLDQVAAKVRSVLGRRDLARSRLGVAVWSVDSGREVVTFEADRLLTPASTAKLITMHTALDLLGAEFEWETSLYLLGKPADRSTLEGDLVVTGDGDPNISARFHEGDTLFLFRRWASILNRNGLTVVTGDLVVDSTGFDRVFVHPAWDPDDLGKHYAAPISALSLNDNCVDLHFGPGPSAGAPARLEIVPDVGHFELQGTIATTSRKADHRLVAWRKPGTNKIVLDGKCWTGAGTETAWLPVDEPDLLFGRALAAVLAEEGIQVRGRVRVAETPTDLSEAFRVDTFRSGMGQTLAVLAKRSQNFYAEQLWKRSGMAESGVGTWDTGRLAANRALGRLGIAATAFVGDDGSGLSRRNRYTANQMLRVLRDEWDGPARDLYFGCLPISGTDGTLERRMRGSDSIGRVRAKTGTMSGVSALAGAVEGQRGRYLFVFLGEGEVGALRQAQDDVCEVLARN